MSIPSYMITIELNFLYLLSMCKKITKEMILKLSAK